MKRIVIAVVYIALILACSTDEDGSIGNTGNDKAILSYLVNLEEYEEQVSGPNSIRYSQYFITLARNAIL